MTKFWIILQSRFIRTICIFHDKAHFDALIPFKGARTWKESPVTPNSIPSFFKNFEKRRKRRRKIFGIGKYVFLWRRLKTEKENIFIAVEKKNREEKGGKYLEKENIFFSGKEEKKRRKMRKIFKEDLSTNCQSLGLKTFANFWRVLVLVERIWSRKRSLGYGFREFGLGKKVSVSVSENLVLEKSLGFD